MSGVFKSRLVRIGNSQGVRIPKPLLQQAGFTDAVEMVVDGDRIIISPPRATRLGWDEQFAAMASAGDDALLDEETSTHFDREDWQW